ncbi:MAG: hypothetical protein ACTSRR_09675 [Candidatus Heimdallarchaeaceae archaeon]
MESEQIRKKIISQGINPDTLVELLEEFISSEESDFFTQIKTEHNFSIWLNLLDWSIFEMVQLTDNWTFMEQRPRICLFYKDATYYDFDEEDEDFIRYANEKDISEIDEYLQLKKDIEFFLEEDMWKLEEYVNIIDDLKNMPRKPFGLTDDQWQVYYLREEDYSYEMIAWLRNTTESTVRDLYAKAKKKIQDVLVPDGTIYIKLSEAFKEKMSVDELVKNYGEYDYADEYHREFDVMIVFESEMPLALQRVPELDDVLKLYPPFKEEDVINCKGVATR